MLRDGARPARAAVLGVSSPTLDSPDELELSDELEMPELSAKEGGSSSDFRKSKTWSKKNVSTSESSPHAGSWHAAGDNSTSFGERDTGNAAVSGTLPVRGELRLVAVEGCPSTGTGAV